MAYMNGNLALQPKRKPEQKPSYRETKKVVVKRKSIPVQEKLLYLFTILACVVVAGVIIFRYAQIYQMEQKITTMTKQQAQMQLQIDDLISKREIANDPKVLKDKAAQLDYVMSDERIQVQTGGDAPVASK
ncbi:Cell division protein FtsL [Paenibacillus sp. UNC496MF]|uniref:hypothetical protein n=1 Tax=Paenibacillus sp. UNC496MF TaxID=1502753 RepID=UPI0008E6CCEC|nr:hypothetical protein [Paenibacillus sp. UNC496MF]SFI60395.1 Cell division protein FtsL [Paenibacillus sp. UNC496MF]